MQGVRSVWTRGCPGPKKRLRRSRSRQPRQGQYALILWKARRWFSCWFPWLSMLFSRLAHFVTLNLQWGTGGGERMSEYQTVSMYSGKQGAVFGAVVLLHLLMGYALYAG